MNEVLRELMMTEKLIPMVAIGGGLCVGAIWIIFGTVQAMVVGTAKEKTKRELAAFVAAGTLEADKAVAIINAGKDADAGA